MTCQVIKRDADGVHEWSLVSVACRLDDPGDVYLGEMTVFLRNSYGEQAVLDDALRELASEIDGGAFRTEHLLAAIRHGLPDPAAEGKKPPHLTNYRSQSAELVARRGGCAHTLCTPA